jgi:hypothetical protein
MSNPTVSHLLTRRYVTELIRSPRAAAALGSRRAPLTKRVAPIARPRSSGRA